MAFTAPAHQGSQHRALPSQPGQPGPSCWLRRSDRKSCRVLRRQSGRPIVVPKLGKTTLTLAPRTPRPLMSHQPRASFGTESCVFSLGESSVGKNAGFSLNECFCVILLFKAFLLFLMCRNVCMCLTPGQFCPAAESWIRIAEFLALCTAEPAAPQDLPCLRAPRKTLQMQDLVLRCSQGCTAAHWKARAFLPPLCYIAGCSTAPKPPSFCVLWQWTCVLFHTGAFCD